MTTKPTRQPEALKLADVLHEVASLFGFPSALLQSATELRRQHAEIASLTDENESLRAVVAEAVAAERERLCAAIKAADDKASDDDYMLDSDDCISVIRGTWNSV